MKRRLLTAFLSLGLVVAGVGLWVVQSRRPEEVAIQKRIRSAEALYLSINFSADQFGPERLILDSEALARSFRIARRIGNYRLSSAISLSLHEKFNGEDRILYLYPWTFVMIGNDLHEVEPSFWTALLEQAPKSKEWLSEKCPDGVEEPFSVHR